MEGRLPLDGLVTTFDWADINRAATVSGATIKPALKLPH